MSLIKLAQDFAHEAHDSIGQKRKYSGESYWVHTDAVAQIGYDALVRAGTAPELVEQAVAGYHLHDYREDVVTKLKAEGRISELNAFEARFEALPTLTRLVVMDMTDVFTSDNYPKMNRAKRKAAERERVLGVHVLSKTGKLADLIHNTESIVANDKDFAQVYLREKFQMLGYLSDGNAELLQRASTQCLQAMQALGIEVPIY